MPAITSTVFDTAAALQRLNLIQNVPASAPLHPDLATVTLRTVEIVNKFIKMRKGFKDPCERLASTAVSCTLSIVEACTRFGLKKLVGQTSPLDPYRIQLEYIQIYIEHHDVSAFAALLQSRVDEPVLRLLNDLLRIRSEVISALELAHNPEEEPYELYEEKVASRGGFSDVHVGFWRKVESPSPTPFIRVAIKHIRPKGMNEEKLSEEDVRSRMLKRLKREVLSWSRAVHRNVLPFLGVSLVPEFMMFSPWCQNGDIVRYLRANPYADRIQLLCQAAEGLKYLHKLNPPITHADIKPDNILINDAGEAVLADFGLSKALSNQPSGLTTDPGARGTPLFMAPELHEDSLAEPSLASDVYAFTFAMLQVLSKRAPFYNLRMYVVLAVQRGVRPLIADYPDPMCSQLWPLFELGWNAEPSARPTMDVILVRLRSLPPDPTIPPTTADMSRRTPQATRFPPVVPTTSPLSPVRFPATQPSPPRGYSPLPTMSPGIEDVHIPMRTSMSGATLYTPSPLASAALPRSAPPESPLRERSASVSATGGRSRSGSPSPGVSSIIAGSSAMIRRFTTSFPKIATPPKNKAGAEQQEGRFKGKRMVWRGEMYEVWKGTWTSGQPSPGGNRVPDALYGAVAIKSLRSIAGGRKGDDVKNFQRQLRSWEHLRHQHVLPLLYSSPIDMMLVSPWTENGTLREYVFRGMVGSTGKFRLLAQVADGLDYLHTGNYPVAHGNLTPDNILVNDAGEAVISGFSFVVPLTPSSPTPYPSTDLIPFDRSSTRYTAPELLSGSQPRSPATDIYSFTMIALEIFSSVRPFHTIREEGPLVRTIAGGAKPRVDDHPGPECQEMWATLSGWWVDDWTRRPTARTVRQLLEYRASRGSPFGPPTFPVPMPIPNHGHGNGYGSGNAHVHDYERVGFPLPSHLN